MHVSILPALSSREVSVCCNWPQLLYTIQGTLANLEKKFRADKALQANPQFQARVEHFRNEFREPAAQAVAERPTGKRAG